MMRRRRDLPPVAPQSWAALIPADSFYARLAHVRDVLVDDVSYAPLSKDSPKGRPSIPPSVVVLTMLLPYYDDCSDREAEARLRFDLRWKPALGLGLEDAGFDATVLCRFRRKLLERGLERVLFERRVQAARAAGLLTKDAVQVLDSSYVLGAAGGRDTYTLLRGGIRKLLRALGFPGGFPGAHPSGLPERLAAYLDPAAPEKPDLDWADPAACAAALGELVADARAALALVDCGGPAGAASGAAQEAATLLTKIVADEVEEGPPSPPKRPGRPRKGAAAPPATAGEPAAGAAGAPAGRERQIPDATQPGPRLRQGGAPDRVLSMVDPQMRWGHKSSRTRAGRATKCISARSRTAS